MLRVGTLALVVSATWASPLASCRRHALSSERQVLTFHTRAWCGLAPSSRRTPLDRYQVTLRVCPGRMGSPRFRRRLICFRRFSDGSLALAFPHLACRDHVPTFLQRSPPSLLTTAARSGLEPAPDRRLRGALPHLSYSCAPPCGPAMLVTHSHLRTLRLPSPETGRASPIVSGFWGLASADQMAIISCNGNCAAQTPRGRVRQG